MNRRFFESFFWDPFSHDPFDDPFFTDPPFGTSRSYTAHNMNEQRRQIEPSKTVSSIEEILEDFIESQPTILPSSIETIDSEEETHTTSSNVMPSTSGSYRSAKYEEGGVVVIDVSAEKNLNLPTRSICKVEHAEDVATTNESQTRHEERRGMTATTTTTRTYTDAYGTRTTTTVTTTRGPHGTTTTTTTTTFSSPRSRRSRGGFFWDWNKSKMVDDR
jgi:hypothetical protein